MSRKLVGFVAMGTVALMLSAAASQAEAGGLGGGHRKHGACGFAAPVGHGCFHAAPVCCAPAPVCAAPVAAVCAAPVAVAHHAPVPTCCAPAPGVHVDPHHPDAYPNDLDVEPPPVENEDAPPPAPEPEA